MKPILCAIAVLVISLMSLESCKSKEKQGLEAGEETLASASERVTFTYREITGIGKDSLYNRRDNSDIIKVGDTYYIWYSRMDSPITAGYWATIWYATSKDGGHTWEEQGMALDVGPDGAFDHSSVFTPNILVRNGKYYLYYTGVKPTPGNRDKVFENNSENDFTAIGLAVADSPDGPFKRVENNPVLKVSPNKEAFDSYRIDDASLMVIDGKIALYYKGRSLIDGEKGPGLTKMGVAYAERPEGPFVKHGEALQDKSHEVLVWRKGKGVATLASISKTLRYAEDGMHFSLLQDSLANIPKAPGLYRPHLENGNPEIEPPGWGVSMKVENRQAFFVRFEMIPD
ncbi:family 43 glycosylhydrolase [Pseudozobellia thermophila]|uniref:Glycosyl hydrolases family 43 n=1 Tax=Pseudozobellia thermophila TaxID=192903 RepID=A0A1M6KT23_9FLAO|nr:family 43 glycosylhydrolase [Pseudozobellia thermophila]SHJ62024.1 Glycosyl hydrolases family 43 [Pseudozobellia thermophila]